MRGASIVLLAVVVVPTLAGAQCTTTTDARAVQKSLKLALRPFSRTQVGVIGDAINVAARLMAVAGPSEIVLSNCLFHQLPEAQQGGFTEIEALDCHNVGRINAWRAGAAS